MKAPLVVLIDKDADIVTARAASRELAKLLGFSTADQTRLATAVSELTRNIISYVGTGRCHIADDSDEGVAKIRIVVEDEGPGISNVEAAMQDGFTTGNGLGAGLPGTRRLVHEFEIDTAPGHTRISIGMASHRRGPAGGMPPMPRRG